MQQDGRYRAARRYVELEEFLGRFREKLETGIETLRSFERDVAGGSVVDADQLQSRLADCEFATYEIVSYVYTLDEISDSITGRFGHVELDEIDPPNRSVPELIGLRNGICHNGLMGMNVAWNANGAQVYVSLDNVRRYADWDDTRTKAEFDRWFGAVSGEVLIIKRALLRGERVVESVVEKLREQLRSEYGNSQFETFASSHPLYRRY